MTLRSIVDRPREEAPIPRTTRSVPALTSLRFVAAMLVVTFHTLPRTDSSPAQWRQFIDHGYVGVSFFFVLSGFILAWTGFGQTYSDPAVRRAFFIRRIARIVPAFWLAAVLAWPTFAWFQYRTLPLSEALTRICSVTGLTMVFQQAWFPWSLGHLNAPSWSVAVEMFLYASFPLLARSIEHRSRSARWTLLALAIAACWIPALLQQTLAQPVVSGVPQPEHRLPLLGIWISSFPLFHFPQFAVGVITGSMAAEMRVADVKRSWPSGVALASIATIVVGLGIQRGSSGLFDIALNHGALAGPFAALFASTALSNRNWWTQLAGWTPLVVLGEASYALYIFQQPVFAWLSIAFARVGLHSWPFTRFIVGACVLVGVSLVFRHYDEQFRPRLVTWLTDWTTSRTLRRLGSSTLPSELHT